MYSGFLGILNYGAMRERAIEQRNRMSVATGVCHGDIVARAVGLSAVMAARLTGAAMIIAIDLHESRLQLARNFGARHTMNPSDIDPIDHILELTGGLGVNVALDTSGIPSVVRQAVQILAVRSSCGIVGVLASSPWRRFH